MFSILLSEFNDDVGKQIVYQFPEELITPVDFEYLSHYVVTKDEFCSKLITFDFKQYLVVSMSILVRHDQGSKVYRREKYIFGISLILEKSGFQPKMISEVIRKLAFVFTNIENTTHNIYNHDLAEIKPLLQKTYNELTTQIKSVIEKENRDVVFLRISELSPQIKISYKDFKYSQVPLPTVDLKQILLYHSPPELVKILPEINGVQCIGVICEKSAPYTSQQVRKCISNLLSEQLVVMVDLIKATNLYAVKDVFTFFRNEQKVQEACEYIFTKAVEQKDKILKSLYMGFRMDVPLDKYQMINAKFLTLVDLNRLIRYGQLNNIISRMVEYPLLLPERTNRYFDAMNYSKYIQSWIPPVQRFYDIDQASSSNAYRAKAHWQHCESQSLAHSIIEQTQVFTNAFNSIAILV